MCFKKKQSMGEITIEILFQRKIVVKIKILPSQRCHLMGVKISSTYTPTKANSVLPASSSTISSSTY